MPTTGFVAAGAKCTDPAIMPRLAPGAEFTVCVTRRVQLPAVPTVLTGRGIRTRRRVPRPRRRLPAGEPMKDDRGSTIPLILGFFLIALIMVVGSVALGQAFVQQRGLQDICDGAAAAAAASSADLDRERGIGAASSLRFADVSDVVDSYLARDADRRSVQVQAALSAGPAADHPDLPPDPRARVRRVLRTRARRAHRDVVGPGRE